MTTSIDVAVYIVARRLEQGGELEQLIARYTDPTSGESLADDESDEVRRRVQRQVDFERARIFAQVEDPAMLADRENHWEWYDDWLYGHGNDRFYWDRLSNFVGEQLQDRYTPVEAGEIVRSTDVASDRILRQMENPQRQAFETKGLVIGHVQSGKTANFTAVIAKAVDAGYRLVVVLTGINNNLRRQTQQRLDRELTGEPDADDVTNVGVPAMEARRWERLTNHDFDFTQASRSNLNVMAASSKPLLAVMKKNVAPLKKFIQWARRSTADSRSALPLLLIDDEADLASIDTNAPRRTAPTATNTWIRTLLDLFPRNAYVGYTATPFANVLINMHTEDPTLGRDLYPRNFIVSLPRPVGYFGAERVFASDTSTAYLRFVPDAEIEDLVPMPRAVTSSLQTAVKSFILSGAARIQRGQGARPMTMLIHTHMRQASHQRMRELVDAYFRALRARWQDQYEREDVVAELRQLWETDFAPTTHALGATGCSFESVETCIGPFLEQLQIFDINTQSDDELDYTQHPDLKVLAIGGNKLSRGLTLEGLTTSFYLRQSKEYDTLLQMGRWFGYRNGYEDLTRVYTSQRLANWFADLAAVEQLLRDEVSRYEDEGLTPVDFAVRIRAHSTMRVTATNKMGAAESVQGSYSKQIRQTFLFPLNDPDFLQSNINAGEALIRIAGSFEHGGGSYLARGVAGEQVVDFLNTYRFRPMLEGGSGIDIDEMRAYIDRLQNAGELTQWNLGVITQQRSAPAGNVRIGYGSLEIVPVTRSRKKVQNDPRYNLGVISDPGDLIMDLPSGATGPHDGRSDPLLLLYRIWRGSAPTAGRAGNREPLFEGLSEPVDVLGLVVVFPESETEPYGFIGQAAGRQ